MKTMKTSNPKKWLALALGLFLIGTGSIFAQSHSYSTDDSMIALEGYSPVSYIEQGKAQMGKKAFKTTYDGITYYFVNPEQQKQFQSNPKKYQPQYGGWCAYAVSLGGKFRPNPKSFRVVDGKLYLFTVNLEGDFVKAWEKEGKDKHIAQADQNWKSMGKFKTF
ncbi:YHS domain-containing (seleno)protein [Flagellimonas beolgyonensis]|uniref:YHS domain-containing (seleno)protein n=1 Tax=Flagellimonas beolgyonensis TaxID=864064 RepID=UPI003D65B436